MKLNSLLTESFQTVSINGILYSLNGGEREIYYNIKERGKILKSDFTEFDQRVATNMVSRGLLNRRKDKQGNLYFTTRGRRKNICRKVDNFLAPPCKESEKWIEKNKEKFKQQYGKGYEEILLGMAWKKYNGKTNILENVNEEIPTIKLKKGDVYISRTYDPNFNTIVRITKLVDGDAHFQSFVRSKQSSEEVLEEYIENVCGPNSSTYGKTIKTELFLTKFLQQYDFTLYNPPTGDDIWDGGELTESKLTENINPITKIEVGGTAFNTNTCIFMTITNIIDSQIVEGDKIVEYNSINLKQTHSEHSTTYDVLLDYLQSTNTIIYSPPGDKTATEQHNLLTNYYYEGNTRLKQIGKVFYHTTNKNFVPPRDLQITIGDIITMSSPIEQYTMYVNVEVLDVIDPSTMPYFTNMGSEIFKNSGKLIKVSTQHKGIFWTDEATIDTRAFTITDTKDKLDDDFWDGNELNESANAQQIQVDEPIVGTINGKFTIITPKSRSNNNTAMYINIERYNSVEEYQEDPIKNRIKRNIKSIPIKQLTNLIKHYGLEPLDTYINNIALDLGDFWDGE